MKKTLKTILLALLPFGLLGVLAFAATGDRYFEIAKNLEIFAGVYEQINTHYVDEVNPNRLLNAGVKAMLGKLDPYTVYIPEDDIEDYRTLATGKYGGIGIQSDRIGDKHLVLMVYEGTPAHEAGILISDEIVALDGVSLADKSDGEFAQLLRGQVGSEVEITLSRNNGAETKKATIKRRKIAISSISYSGMVDHEVGYLKLSEFTKGAGAELRKAVRKLKDEGAGKIILDLRGNPGGLMGEAVDICNVFLDKNKKIVHTKGKTQKHDREFVTRQAPLDLTIPLAVLINSTSASASEIVSGVMQDYDRAILVGQRSYGKGLVQESKKLSYNSQLKLTIAKYYIPSGRCIQALDYSHRRPDGSVGKIPDSLISAFQTANGREVFDGGGIEPDIETKPTALSAYAGNLSNSGLIFDYASKYYFEHDTISNPGNFRLTDEEYDDFLIWMKSKQFDNESPVEQTISELKETASKDKVYKNLLGAIEKIQTTVAELKAKGINTYREEIKRLLEKEIVGRYYLRKGAIEASLAHDADVNKAIAILNDHDTYQHLLLGNR